MKSCTWKFLLVCFLRGLTDHLFFVPSSLPDGLLHSGQRRCLRALSIGPSKRTKCSEPTRGPFSVAAFPARWRHTGERIDDPHRLLHPCWPGGPGTGPGRGSKCQQVRHCGFCPRAVSAPCSANQEWRLPAEWSSFLNPGKLAKKEKKAVCCTVITHLLFFHTVE